MNEKQKEVFEYFKINAFYPNPESQLVSILTSYDFDFCISFFHIAKLHKLIYVSTFRNSFLHKNLLRFTEKQLYYLYEGLKIQITQQHHEFFLLFHYFVVHVDSLCFQKLLLYLLSNEMIRVNCQGVSIKIYECVISNNLLLHFINKDPTVHQLKLIKLLYEIKHPAIKKYVNNHDIEIDTTEMTGCKSYFKEWLQNTKNK